MIGVFDSGLGGLSVLSAISLALPNADLVYFADTAHVPYGDRDDAYIRQRVLKIGRHLVDQGCSLLVVACNTATAAAVAALREAMPETPSVGVEPGVKPAAAASKSGRIAVLTTASTARSERLARLIERHAGAVQVDVLPCPGWATKVETLHLDDPGFAEQVRQHLSPALEAGADQIVLGCTHYPLLMSSIVKHIPDGVRIVPQGKYVADSLKNYLERHAQMESMITKGGTCQYLTTESEDKFQDSALIFLHEKVNVRHVDLD